MKPTAIVVIAGMMAALDMLLCMRVQNPRAKLDSLRQDLENLHDHLWYCSDGGISRIFLSLETGETRLEGPPSEDVKRWWETDPEVPILRRELKAYVIYAMKEAEKEARCPSS